MKKIFPLLCAVAFSSAVFTSCKKDENRVIFDKGTAPVLTAASTTLPLNYADRDNEGIKLSWTNPNYQLNTGISSYDVSYEVEIDTTGANFTNPNKKTLPLSKDLGLSITQGTLNDYLLNQLQLAPAIAHNIEFRVKSFLIGGTGTLYSNVLKYTVTPYAIPPKVAVPTTNKLFITGSATPASWQCGCGEPELASQQFTQLSPTLFEIASINLNGGQSYLLLPRYGTWNAVAPDPEKYGGTGSNNANNVNGDDFKARGGDLLAPPVSGAYKITVDFQRGKFTVVKL